MREYDALYIHINTSTVDFSSIRTLRGAFAVLRNIIHNVLVKVPPTSNILPQEADYEYCYDPRCASADALHSVRTELKSTVARAHKNGWLEEERVTTVRKNTYMRSCT